MDRDTLELSILQGIDKKDITGDFPKFLSMLSKESLFKLQQAHREILEHFGIEKYRQVKEQYLNNLPFQNEINEDIEYYKHHNKIMDREEQDYKQIFYFENE